jgi:uncharacterized SAM-binding protein YcdF (DUF218 family)
MACGVGLTALFVAQIAWLSIPEMESLLMGLGGLAVAAVAWMVLLGATIVRRTRARWTSVALFPALLAVLIVAAGHIQRVGPWLEFLPRHEALNRIAAKATADTSSIGQPALHAVGATAIEVRPGYVALLHQHSEMLQHYGFLRQTGGAVLPALGSRLFGQPLVELTPLRDGWYLFQTTILND